MNDEILSASLERNNRAQEKRFAVYGYFFKKMAEMVIKCQCTVLERLKLC